MFMIVRIPPWNKTVQLWLEAGSYQLETAVLLKYPVAGYININKDIPNSMVSVFIYVLLPTEAAVKRIGFGEVGVS